MKLYIGNLPWTTSEEELKKLFEKHGKVRNVNILTFPDTSKSRGFGFVEMEQEQEAIRARDALNGFELAGRQLKVADAHNQ